MASRNFRHSRRKFALTAALCCAAIALTSSAVRADGWVPCNASGTPLSYGSSPDITADGQAVMLNSGIAPNPTITGTYALLSSDWTDTYSPHAPFYPLDPWEGLDVYTSGSNVLAGRGVGYYDPHDDVDERETAPMPDFPEVGGTVNSSTSDTLTAHFVWTGSGAPPNPSYFLINESASASAQVIYGTSGYGIISRRQ